MFVLAGASSVLTDSGWQSSFLAPALAALADADSVLCCDAPAVIGLYLASMLTGCELPAVFCTTPVAKDAEVGVSSLLACCQASTCVPLTAATLASLTAEHKKTSTTMLRRAAVPAPASAAVFFRAITRVRYGERVCWCGSNGAGSSGCCTSPACTSRVTAFPTGLHVGGCGFVLESLKGTVAFIGPCSAKVGRHPRQFELASLARARTLVLLVDPPELTPTLAAADELKSVVASIGVSAVLWLC